MTEPPPDQYPRDFLRDIDVRAPQSAAFLALLAVAAAAPAQVHPRDLRALHARYPKTRGVGADALNAITDPMGTHNPLRGGGVGGVGPSGNPAYGLVYDRRLGILTWVDEAGEPTYAPPEYREATLNIVGPAQGSAAAAALYYAFAERQRQSASIRTVELAQRLLGEEAIGSAPKCPSPFDRCNAYDVELVRQEQAATIMASRAVVTRAIHEVRLLCSVGSESARVGDRYGVVSRDVSPLDVDAVAAADLGHDQGNAHPVVPTV